MCLLLPRRYVFAKIHSDNCEIGWCGSVGFVLGLVFASLPFLSPSSGPYNCVSHDCTFGF